MNVNVKFITLNFNGLQLKPCSTENSGTKKKMLADSPCSMDDISFGEFLSLDLWTEYVGRTSPNENGVRSF